MAPPTAPDRIGLPALARRWQTYPALLEGLCERAGVPIHRDPDGRKTRRIDRDDVPRLRTFYASYRSFRGASKGQGHHWHPIV